MGLKRVSNFLFIFLTWRHAAITVRVLTEKFGKTWDEELVPITDWPSAPSVEFASEESAR